MARKMLINATRPEEVRVAIVHDTTMEAYEVAASESGLIKGNIYRGIVVSVRPALEAAFVDIGTGKDALVRADDIVPEAMHRKHSGSGRPRIEQILEKGKTLTVQVTRDPIAHKGAQATTNISLAGRYLVAMPFDDVRGVSRRTEDEEVRKAAKEKLASMDLPENLGIIVRTNALDQPKAALNRDLNALHRLWKKIKKEAGTGKGTKLLYSDQDLVVQALRDHLDSSITEVLIDDDEVFAKAKGYMASFMPRAKIRLTRYNERMPLFSKFDLEEQIDRIYQRSVDLPSGGSIVIDGTEALTAIDVNSGRGTKGGSQEENAFRTNIQAASAVGRQLRMRDIGGLIVVDFIDMRASKNNREVEKTLRDAMKSDKARHTVSKISPNGLLEINRQRIKKALQLRSHRPCPTCSGSGTIASSELVGLNLLRRIEARAATGRLLSV
ncbi:MAG: ribonuclease E, partial [Acidobacteria bacterium]